MMKRLRLPLQHGASIIDSIENLARQSEHCLILDSHHHVDAYGKFERLIAWDAHAVLKADGPDPLQELQAFRAKHEDWLLGHISFDLKNKLEPLESSNSSPFAWADLQFFVPKNLVYCQKGQWFLESSSFKSAEELQQACNQDLPKDAPPLHYQAQNSLEDYLDDIASLKKELQYGSIYEINYCTLFEARGPLEPFARYRALRQKHQAPFGGYYRDRSQHLLCFSPERYLRKIGNSLISQPIKGTTPRHPDPEKDEAQKAHLLESEKERAENVMIVDLVRNDLSRTARKNSVSVPELFGLYSFKAVHHMISTVRSELNAEKYSAEDAIRFSFPMGSMTGAPKISALELIDKHEHFKRGIYSGSIGYFDPDGDFDFNVVIRSIQYQEELQIAQVAVGSAITIHCDAEAEYKECLLKAEKLIR